MILKLTRVDIRMYCGMFARRFCSITTLLSALAYSAGSIAGVCIKEGTSIDVTGAISLEAYPAQPNYRSVEHGDALELVYVLTSDSSRGICIEPREAGQAEGVEEVQRFQLTHAQSVIFTTSPIVNGRAHVRGKVWVAMTGHYHAPAAIDMAAFQNEGNWSPPLERGTFGLIPITVSFRHAKIGSSLVGEIKNQSKMTLSTVVAMGNPTTNKARTIAITLPPFREKNIGFGEGWSFASGDRILFHTATFTDIAVLVP